MEYIITDHAKERYAERIADKEGNCDIKQYVACNNDKIVSDINKMMEYSELIAQGKFGKKYEAVRLFVCGLWAVLVDPEQPRIITLYKIDLGVGDEFNKEYMSKSLDKIKDAKADYEKTIEGTKEEVKGLEDYIEANNETIAELKATIKSLEKLNGDLGETIKDINAKNKAAEINMCRCVESLITKRSF